MYFWLSYLEQADFSLENLGWVHFLTENVNVNALIFKSLKVLLCYEGEEKEKRSQIRRLRHSLLLVTIFLYTEYLILIN
jgi:hypothetical protein